MSCLFPPLECQFHKDRDFFPTRISPVLRSVSDPECTNKYLSTNLSLPMTAKYLYKYFGLILVLIKLIGGNG